VLTAEALCTAMLQSGPTRFQWRAVKSASKVHVGKPLWNVALSCGHVVRRRSESTPKRAPCYKCRV